MSRPILGGSTDVSTVIRIIDSTDGSPETGVTSATAGLALWYRREGGTVVALTESDLAQTDSAHADGGMIHLSDGLYRVDLPDAAVAAGAGGVTVGGTVTGMIVIPSYHAIDAPSDVRKWLGTACATPTTAGVPEVDVTYVNGTAAEVSAGDGSDWTAIPWNAAWDEEVQSEVEDGLAAYGANTVVPDVAGTAASLVSGLESHGDSAWATATGFSTHSAADVVTALGTGSTLTACATATGFSTHSAADVVTALGTGSTLTACLTATGFSTLDAAGVRTAVGLALANLDTQLTAMKGATFDTSTDSLEALRNRGDAAWATATSVTVSDKTGFKLASDGLDSVSTTGPNGVAANFREMIVAVWRKWFGKQTMTTTTLTTYRDDGTTAATEQTLSDDGTTQSQGKASNA